MNKIKVRVICQSSPSFLFFFTFLHRPNFYCNNERQNDKNSFFRLLKCNEFYVKQQNGTVYKWCSGMFPWRCQLWKPISPSGEIQENHWQDLKIQYVLVFPLPSTLTYCNLLEQLGSSQTTFMKRWNCWGLCGLTSCLRNTFQGQMVGEDTRDPSALLWVIIWWIMTGSCHVWYDQSCRTRIRRSQSSVVYLSAFPFLTPFFLLSVDPTLSSALVSFHLIFRWCPPKSWYFV